MLVVLEIRSKEYGISEARAACKRDEERLVDGSDSYPAVAVEKANPVRPPMEDATRCWPSGGIARDGLAIPWLTCSKSAAMISSG